MLFASSCADQTDTHGFALKFAIYLPSLTIRESSSQLCQVGRRHDGSPYSISTGACVPTGKLDAYLWLWYRRCSINKRVHGRLPLLTL